MRNTVIARCGYHPCCHRHEQSVRIHVVGIYVDLCVLFAGLLQGRHLIGAVAWVTLGMIAASGVTALALINATFFFASCLPHSL